MAVLFMQCSFFIYAKAMANSLDLGSVWINQLRWLNENPALLEDMREIGLEDDERVYGALAVGYADTEDGLPVRKPLERTGNKVTYVDRKEKRTSVFTLASFCVNRISI